MFFKVLDEMGDIGYINLSVVEFIREDLNGSITIYFASKGNPLKLSSEKSKEILHYLKSITNIQ